MNKVLPYIILIIASSLSAQVDRTKVPEAGPAPKIELKGYESFTLNNGLEVFVVENHKLPRIAFSLSIDMDPILEGETAGYVSIAGQLLRNGTTNRTKAQLDEEIDFIGASLNTSSTGIFASSLKKHADQLLDLMTDVLYNPSFLTEEFEKIKKQTISGLQASKEDPDAIASNVVQVLRYGKDHPYGELTTEETVGKIDIETIRSYYNTYFKPNIAYLAIVGDINRSEAENLVKRYFNRWEKGDVPNFQYNIPSTPMNNQVALVDRKQSVQSVINITYPINLKPGAPDVVKSSVMNTILGGGFSSNLMQNLREDHGYTYGAGSSLRSDELVGSFNASASVRNEVTDSSVVEFLYELKRIRTDTIEDQKLTAIKNYMTGSFARSLENPQTIAGFAINIRKYGLPDDYYATYLERLNNVSSADVLAMANKYIQPGNAHIIIVGKVLEIGEKLSQFGEVKYYDIYGNEIDPARKIEIPEGLTADKVISDYILALGGEEKINLINDITVKMNANAMGQELIFTRIKKAPNKMLMEIKMGEAVINKIVSDGTNISISQMGQKVPVDQNTKDEQLFEAYIIPEMKYSQFGIKTKILSIQLIEGTEAYEIEVVYPNGSISLDYFDRETGLKIRSSKTVQSPQGEIIQNVDIRDYKVVEGVMFPFTLSIPLGPQKIVAEVTSIEFNTGINDELFIID